MKKGIKLLIIAVAYLAICYSIGQYRNSLTKNGVASDKLATEEKVNMVTEQTEESGSKESDDLEIWDNLFFTGVKETSDTPWNMNAGVFDMEENGKCILLMPNTAVTIKNIQDRDELAFEYEIHPWVKDSSDGAGIIIWLLDDQNNIIFEDTMIVDCNKEWQFYTLELAEYPMVASIEILCNNGANNNDEGDWVILRRK